MSIDNVQDITPRVQYVATAGQTEFPYPFPIFDEDDLRVYVDGTLQTKTTDYTVSGVGNDNGGTVTFTSALSGDEVVTIYRETEIARTTDFQQNGPWRSTSTNDELDRITVIIQELKAEIGRCLRFPKIATVASDAIELGPIANWLDRYIYINSSGQPEPAVISETTVTQSIIGSLLYPQTPAEVAAGVTPVNYAYPVAPAIDARRYLSGTDYATAIQNAINVANEIGAVGGAQTGATVYLDPAVNWDIGSTTILLYDGIEVVGGSVNSTRVRYTGSGNAFESATRDTTRIFRGAMRRLWISGDNKVSGSCGIDMRRIDQWVFEDVWIYQFDIGIRFDGTGSAGYRNRYVRGQVEFCNTGIQSINDANEQHFYGTKITNNTHYGADIQSGDSTTFISCNWETNGTHIRSAGKGVSVLFGRMEDTDEYDVDLTATSQDFVIMGVTQYGGSGFGKFRDLGKNSRILMHEFWAGIGDNYIRNGIFECWSAGTSSPPDCWTNTGASIARSTDSRYGSYSMQITANAVSDYVYSQFDIPPVMRGGNDEWLVLMWIKATTSNDPVIQVVPQDGSGNTQGDVIDWRGASVGGAGTQLNVAFWGRDWLPVYMRVKPNTSAVRIRAGIKPSGVAGSGVVLLGAAYAIPLGHHPRVFRSHHKDLAPGLTNILVSSVTHDFDGTDGATTTLTVPGAAIGDHVLVTAPFATADVMVSGYVSAADTITLVKRGAGDPSSATYPVLVFKR